MRVKARLINQNQNLVVSVVKSKYIIADLKQWWYRVRGTAEAIIVGYSNLFRYRVLNNISDEYVDEYKRKKAICKECPLRGRMLGIPVCSTKKEVNGVTGCGCIEEAKLFSDSPCPLDKF